MRLRLLWRNPGVLFWTFVFPVVVSMVLGTAFEREVLGPVKVAIVDGEGAQSLAERLASEPELAVLRLTPEEAHRQLTQGKVAMVLVPGPALELRVDPSRPEGRSARLLVESALAPPSADRKRLRATPVSEPGSRYVDFLIPGLLGLSLMSTSVWTMALPLVIMRGNKLLKRLGATPMRRGHFFAAFALARGVFALLEMVFFCAFARLAYGVPMVGGYLAFAGVVLLGATCFGGLGLLAASRIDSDESANGVFNVVTLPMVFLSGVFFPLERLPGWARPLIEALPLTPLNEALRGIMLEGAGMTALAVPLAVLLAWSVVFYAGALRFFRWV
ncbi:ABC transporter permease [Myxococcaceae bacterium JPH2]|nr:ABC transporter permease [Myxococcaceae bacterium JPH2]